MSVCDEIRTLDKNRSGRSERGKRLFGGGDKLSELGFCARGSKHADHSCFARPRVLAGLLADKRRVTFKIEQIIGNLEGLADGRSIPPKCLALKNPRV